MNTAQLELRFLQDRLSAGRVLDRLPACHRIVYVISGSATIGAGEIPADEGWLGAESVSMTAGAKGAKLWRWELWPADAAPADPAIVLRAPITTLDAEGSWLMRLDSVSFPPGGCAYLHVHQGPGIRCLVEGNIRIDSEGASTWYAPGAPWFESGPEPVFAQADDATPTRFVRVMVLPRTLLGERSIRYLRDEDRDKPKAQSYRIYLDEPADF